MAQHDYIISNATFPAVRADINNALSAIQTNNSGTSRPTGAVAGQIWLDTTNATSPTLKFFDGADDISLATINYTANTVDWLDSSVTITGLSTTATGTVLTLSDTATTSSVNLIIDNQKEIRFRETTANGTNYVAFKAPASLASDLTFTLPSTDGASGQALVTNGSGVLSFASAGISWQSVQTTGFTASAGKGYPCNTTSSAFTVTLPVSATAGDTIILVDYAGTFDTNALIINPNGLKIEGGTSNLQLTGDREGATLTYIDSTQGWIATSGIQEGTDSLSSIPYSVDFLVIAGGGGGGYDDSGGGGAGGYRNSYSTESSGGGGSSETELTLSGGTVYTITVGAGGAGSTAGGVAGVSGGSSSISGSNITTITSSGGGGGNNSANAGASGGSGGGAGWNTATGGSGTSNQGYAGGGGSQDGNVTGGGGGGAGETGGTDGTGFGGDGLASSITGSSVTRGGGGSGSTRQSGTAKVAGDGGGGTGGVHTPHADATNGTANTGGGGGGGAGSSGGTIGQNGGAGGSGVVILRMLSTNYSGTTTGSPTVTTDGSYKVLTFNASGSYTA